MPGEDVFHVAQVVAHGGAGCLWITCFDGCKNGLVVAQRHLLMMLQSREVRKRVEDGGEDACPQAIHNAGEDVVTRRFGDRDVEVAVGDLCILPVSNLNNVIGKSISIRQIGTYRLPFLISNNNYFF